MARGPARYPREQDIETGDQGTFDLATAIRDDWRLATDGLGRSRYWPAASLPAHCPACGTPYARADGGCRECCEAPWPEHQGPV